MKACEYVVGFADGAVKECGKATGHRAKARWFVPYWKRTVICYFHLQFSTKSVREWL